VPFASATSVGRYAVVSETTATEAIRRRSLHRQRPYTAAVPRIDPIQVKARRDVRIREIEERREALRRGGEGLRDELADYDQHPGDQGTETFVQELDATTDMILDEEEQRVKDARRALDDGRYGICADCGRE